MANRESRCGFSPRIRVGSIIIVKYSKTLFHNNELTMHNIYAFQVVSQKSHSKHIHIDTVTHRHSYHSSTSSVSSEDLQIMGSNVAEMILHGLPVSFTFQIDIYAWKYLFSIQNKPSLRIRWTNIQGAPKVNNF